jgi:hypothetical protein
MGMEQLSHATFTGCPFRWWEQRRCPGADLAGNPAQRDRHRVDGQHLAVAAQHLLAFAGEPDERAPPVGGVAFALEQALARQPVDDLADHRLGPAEVQRGGRSIVNPDVSAGIRRSAGPPRRGRTRRR